MKKIVIHLKRILVRNELALAILLLTILSLPLATAQITYEPLLLDPGHGGTDGGTSWCQIVEETFVLDIANEAYTRIQNDLNCPWDTYMTRHTDISVTLARRTQIANNASGL